MFFGDDLLLLQLLLHRDVERLGVQLGQRVARPAQVIGQFLGQALVEGRVLHVDRHVADVRLFDLLGDAVRFFLRGQRGH